MILDFVQLSFVVKCHQLDVILGGVTNERLLFIRIGVYNARRSHVQAQYFLDLALKTSATAAVS